MTMPTSPRRWRVALLGLGLWGAAGCSAPRDPAIAITGATVIDGTGRAPIPDATIVIRAGRIAAVGPAADVAVPRGATRVDARGRFVIPGLWDAHVHLASLGRDGLATLVRYGITSVRDLGGDLDSVRTWRDAVEAGQIEGPRIHLTGPIIEDATWLAKVSSLPIPGLKDLIQGRIPVGTEAEAVAAADSIAKLGVEVLKVRNSPPLPAYRALLEEARLKGLLVAGHQPNPGVGLAGALAERQRSIEHIEQLSELEALPAVARDSMARAFAAESIWFTPTLVTSFRRFDPDSQIEARVAGTSHEPEEALVTPTLLAFWKLQRGLKPFDAPLVFMRQAVDSGLMGMRRLRAAGVRIMVGTDLGAISVYPGLAVHEELALLVDSLGLSPLEAIQAATVEPARYFGIEREIGTIEPGRAADLLILSADPLADVRNTRRIEHVVLRGRVAWTGDGAPGPTR
jgi:imidazolonepropionase-like amidohydrolase